MLASIPPLRVRLVQRGRNKDGALEGWRGNDCPLGSPWVFVSVASKGLNVCVSALESILAGISISVDSKGT